MIAESESGSVYVTNSSAPTTSFTTHRTLRRRLADVVQRMRKALTSCTADTSDVHVPLHVSLLLLAGYVLLGALLFGLWEHDWTSMYHYM